MVPRTTPRTLVRTAESTRATAPPIPFKASPRRRVERYKSSLAELGIAYDRAVGRDVVEFEGKGLGYPESR